MTTPSYEVFAIRYATRDARRSEHFIGGDPLVMKRYPAVSPDLEGVAVRLDANPSE